MSLQQEEDDARDEGDIPFLSRNFSINYPEALAFISTNLLSPDVEVSHERDNFPERKHQ